MGAIQNKEIYGVRKLTFRTPKTSILPLVSEKAYFPSGTEQHFNAGKVQNIAQTANSLPYYQ